MEFDASRRDGALDGRTLEKERHRLKESFLVPGGLESPPPEVLGKIAGSDCISSAPRLSALQLIGSDEAKVGLQFFRSQAVLRWSLRWSRPESTCKRRGREKRNHKSHSIENTIQSAGFDSCLGATLHFTDDEQGWPGVCFHRFSPDLDLLSGIQKRGTSTTGSVPMDLSIIIINWNAASHLSRCLDSVSALIEEVDEIVVADNHSSDASRETVRRYPDLRLIENKTNLGFGAAANRAVASTSSRHILLLNSDTLVSPGSARRLHESMLSDTGSAIACGPLVGEGGTPQTGFQFRELPTVSSVLTDVLGLEELLAVISKKPPAQMKTGWLPSSVQPAAAYWMIRRRAWSELGGFDERFWPAWFEDVDFCKRLESSRWKVLFDERARAVHIGGVSVGRLGHRRFTRVFYHNLLRYLKKHHPYRFLLLWLPIQFGSLIRQYLLSPLKSAQGW